jgi:hypothetical protein
VENVYPKRGKYEPFVPHFKPSPRGRRRHIPVKGQTPTAFMERREADSAGTHVSRRKYPLLLVEEAARLVVVLRQQGVKGAIPKAAQIAGVGIRKLKAYLCYKGLTKRDPKKGKYTPEQIRECYEEAVKLMREKKLTKMDAFRKAGEKVGINGETVRCHVRDGFFVPGRD